MYKHKFITLHRYSAVSANSYPIALNGDQIALIEEGDGRTHIMLSDGSKLMVDERVEDILELVNDYDDAST